MTIDVLPSLKDAASWHAANCLVLSVNKTVGMLIGSTITNDGQNGYCSELDDESVQSVSEYLGVHVDAVLKFDKYVVKNIKILQKKLSWSGRLRHIVPS